MSVVTNTLTSPNAVGNREELSDVVDRVAREDTPIYSLIGTTSFSTTHPEWETEDLNAPEDNVQTEGDDYTFSAASAPERVGNYTQIMRKSGIVSGTQEAMNQAGDNQKVKHQKLLRGIELRKDVEFSIVTANASVAGATRKSGSLSTWITSNVSRAGSNGGFNSSTGLTVAPTNGSQRAFTKVIMDDVAQQGSTAGAKYTHLVVSPYVKSVFVTFMSDSNVASFRYSASNGKGNSIVANADIYEGPFGKLTVMPNTVMTTSGTARNAFFVDPSKAQWGWYRKIMEDKDIAKTGDAKKFVLIGEGALKVKNEKGLGVAADLFGLTAST